MDLLVQVLIVFAVMGGLWWLSTLVEAPKGLRVVFNVVFVIVGALVLLNVAGLIHLPLHWR